MKVEKARQFFVNLYIAFGEGCLVVRKVFNEG
jgi:hypothetical protein